MGPKSCSAANNWAGFVHVDPSILEWSARKHAVAQTITASGTLPDIICLVDDDSTDPYLSAVLPTHDRQSRANHTIYWRRDRFTIQETSEIRSAAGTFLGLAVVLSECIVVTTHTPSNITALLDQVVIIASDWRRRPILLTGDMSSASAQAVLKHPLALSSAYPERSYTTWTVRDTEIKECTDYIFYSAGLAPIRRTVPPPTATVFDFPSARWPSSHLSLKVEFLL